jgi:hypothetical protein
VDTVSYILEFIRILVKVQKDCYIFGAGRRHVLGVCRSRQCGGGTSKPMQMSNDCTCFYGTCRCQRGPLLYECMLLFILRELKAFFMDS